MSDLTPNQIMENLIAFRDMADLSRSERDLIADACNMISSLQWRLKEATSKEETA